MKRKLKRFGEKICEQTIGPDTTVCWFRRDLRLTDNTGLYFALKEAGNVQPVFIFDTNILDKLEDDRDARVAFILDSLAQVELELAKLGASLLIWHGNPADFFRGIEPKAVYTNRDYEPYARKRDNEIAALLGQRNIPFRVFKDHVVFEPNEVLKDDGQPYTVFTPYSRKWKSRLADTPLQTHATGRVAGGFKKTAPLPFPSLSDLGFKPAGLAFPDRVIRQAVIEMYDTQRNFPALPGTSRLGVHLRFGTVSIRTLALLALKKSEAWLNELVWRDFYQMILWHFPRVETRAFKPAYDKIVWRNDEDEFKRWCDGQTGYPLVDAGMRELNATGFMHNRVRMVVASFLTKHLLTDWRWGEAYFAKKLLDFDLAANNGGWQWAAGSGCDAAPYFRVFNPALQTEKFDPQMAYIKKWVPETGSPQYPPPVVDHAFARDRALQAYKEALA